MAVKIGDPAPDFRLPATDGSTYSYGDVAGEGATVVLFWCNHCPYVQGSEKRTVALVSDFASRGVGFAAVNANRDDSHPEDSFDNMKLRAGQQGYNFAYLRDEGQDTARAYGAERTPEAFVFDAQHALRYHGRIDDNPKDESAASSHDLRNALEAVLDGKLPDPAETGAIGCTIKWK